MDLRKDFTTEMLLLMKDDDKIVVLTGDLGFNILEPIQKKYPDRFINCGIAECNMIGVACGLVLGGFKPYVYSNALFLLSRANEFIRDEVCYNNLNVRLCGTGASGFLGFSHNMSPKEDELLLSPFPNIKRFYPQNREELREALLSDGPLYVKI